MFLKILNASYLYPEWNFKYNYCPIILIVSMQAKHFIVQCLHLKMHWISCVQHMYVYICHLYMSCYLLLFSACPLGQSDNTFDIGKGTVEVLQFKATVWPKVASESTYEAQKFQNFLGEHTPDPPSCFCIPYSKGLKVGRGLGRRLLLANVMCPRCALASAVFWLRHCPTPFCLATVYS